MFIYVMNTQANVRQRYHAVRLLMFLILF